MQAREELDRRWMLEGERKTQQAHADNDVVATHYQRMHELQKMLNSLTAVSEEEAATLYEMQERIGL